jgi:phosphatidylglycerophosphate synthase
MKMTIPTTAVIRSSGFSVFEGRIGGLYLLERNIRLLWHAGIKNLYLDLSDLEKEFYESHIEPRVSSLNGIVIRVNGRFTPKGDHIDLESSHFIQYYHLVRFNAHFIKKGASYLPGKDHDIFVIKRPDEVKKAEKKALEHIRLSAGGFFARNINKRISLPMSLLFSRLSIHPNVLTTANFIIMIIGGSLLWYGGYVYELIAGAIFNFVSIFDGCDGEVAKLNCRFSKFGSIFDTTNDYICLLYYFAGMSYVFYKTSGSGPLIMLAIIGFTGILVMMGAIIAYIRKFSQSGSFVAYIREFLDKLPKSDPFVWITSKLQYATRKEFYSWAAFLACIPGYLYLMVPYVAIVTSVGAISLVVINIRYFPKLPKVKRNIEMTYVSRRR